LVRKKFIIIIIIATIFVCNNILGCPKIIREKKATKTLSKQAFHGRHIKGASTPHPPETSGEAELSINQGIN
jgi:hypothetical protein